MISPYFDNEKQKKTIEKNAEKMRLGIIKSILKSKYIVILILSILQDSVFIFSYIKISWFANLFFISHIVN